MRKKHIQNFVRNYLKENINKEDIIVDATCGNGNDTLFLAEISKFVYGFDIQKLAIDNTNKLLTKHNLTNYKLVYDSHENIFNYINSFKGVVFNLGYLPRSDKAITTLKKTTIKTLETLTSKMEENSFIIITCYPNHKEGMIESLGVLEFAQNLDSNFTVIQYELLNKVNNPPFVIVIEKEHKGN